MMLSLNPSERYSALGSALTFTKGKTATESIASPLLVRLEKYAIAATARTTAAAKDSATSLRRLISLTRYSALEAVRADATSPVVTADVEAVSPAACPLFFIFAILPFTSEGRERFGRTSTSKSFKSVNTCFIV